MSYPMNGSFVVIEQEQESKTDCYFNTFYYLVISFVYAAFLCVLVNRMLNNEGIEQHCSEKNMPQFGSDEYMTKKTKCEKLRKQFSNKKFVYLVVLGIISIVGGVSVAHTCPEYCTGGSGVAVGGLLVVVYETLVNWTELRDDVKIIMLGSALLATFYASTRYMF